MDTRELTNIASPLVDIMQGAPDSVYNKWIAHIDMDKVKLALDYILNNDKLSDAQRLDLVQNSYKVTYRSKPPSCEEFLTEKYLGLTAESIYPRVRNAFIDFFDEKKPYRHAVLYPHISWGKSYLATLINLYIVVHFSLMRNPKKMLNLSQATTLYFVLCSFNLTKAAEVLLNPFLNMLEGSEFFQKVRTQEDMAKKEIEFKHIENIEHIYWTTASNQSNSALKFSNNLCFKLVSDPANLLGLSIVSGTISELNLFRTAGGWSEENIFQFYSDLRGRIYSRMKGNYWSRSVLDSSPYDESGKVDQYCLYEAQLDPTNYIIKGSMWQHDPESFDLTRMFPIFLGGNGRPPKVLTKNEGQNPSEILMVPESLRDQFTLNLKKSLKDYAGIPSGSLDKLISDESKIEECFTSSLRNINYILKADYRQTPSGLIFNQIKDELFVKHGNRYKFYYKPNIPRCVSIDASITGDLTGISVGHVERKYSKFGTGVDALKDVMYILDFTIAIGAFNGRINLDSLREFIIDLVSKGSMAIVKGSYDSFQSESSLQHLARYGENLEMEKLSVDETMDPYLTFSSLLEQGNIKVGRNIILKNNMRSLRITKRKNTNTLKVDHSQGKIIDENGDVDFGWDTGIIGTHAKDLMDSSCAVIELCKRYLAISPLSLREVWNENEVELTDSQLKEKADYLLKDMGLILNC